MTIDPLLSLLVGALGAATLTVVGGFVGAWVQSRREHSRWIREERLVAYRDVLQLAATAPPYGDEKYEKHIREQTRALYTVELLGPEKVHAEAVALVSWSDVIAEELAQADLAEAVDEVAEKVGGQAEREALRLRRNARATEAASAQLNLEMLRENFIDSTRRVLGVKP